MKNTVIFILKWLTVIVIFPVVRWYKINLFLYTRRDLELNEQPSRIWLITGRIFMYAGFLYSKLHSLFQDEVVRRYSSLIRTHYLHNAAHDQAGMSRKEYRLSFEKMTGSIRPLFENSFLIKVLDVRNTDSFLDCGCGQGKNCREVLKFFPEAKVTAFDISSAAISFAKEMIENKSSEFFHGSAADMNLWRKFGDQSVDNIFFANMFDTILENGIEETRKTRQMIINEAVRIAKKNVIIIGGEFLEGTKTIIEQKYRALFEEDYSGYFKVHNKIGDIFYAPKTLLFHKKY